LCFVACTRGCTRNPNAGSNGTSSAHGEHGTKVAKTPIHGTEELHTCAARLTRIQNSSSSSGGGGGGGTLHARKRRETHDAMQDARRTPQRKRRTGSPHCAKQTLPHDRSPHPVRASRPSVVVGASKSPRPRGGKPGPVGEPMSPPPRFVENGRWRMVTAAKQLSGRAGSHAVARSTCCVLPLSDPAAPPCLPCLPEEKGGLFEKASR
jgi:hypothetical protein